MSESHEPYTPVVGEVVLYTDEVGIVHDALVVSYYGMTQPDYSLSCVYMSSDETKTDNYGRQIERAASVARQREGVTAHGRYWNPKI